MSAGKNAPAGLPAPATAALDAARAALKMREDLSALQAKLETEYRQSLAEADKQRTAAEEAEVDAALSGKVAMPEASGQARTAAEAAEANAKRLGHILAALPARVAEADVAIEAACPALQAGQAEAFRVAVELYGAELREAAEQFSKVLLRGHALNAATKGGLRPMLDGLRVPPARYGEPDVIRDGTYLRAGTVDLSEAWRRDGGAAALHALHAPMRDTLDTMCRHLARIAAQRHQEAQAVLDRQREDRPRLSTGGPPSPPPEPYTPPKGTFVPRSFEVREPGEPPSRRHA